MSLWAGPVAAVALMLATAPGAAAHGTIAKAAGILTYIATDPDVATHVTITSPERGSVVIADKTSPGGMDWGPCVPVSERRARCKTRGVQLIEVEVADGDDRVVVTAATPVRVIAGADDDFVKGGLGADDLRGGSGKDTLEGGEGADTIDGSTGDDEIRASDGFADGITCGDGSDSVLHDTDDQIALPELLACESRAAADPEPDTTPPGIRLSASRRLAGDRSLPVHVRTSEPATVMAGGFVDAGGERYPLKDGSGSSDAPGQTVSLRLGLRRDDARAVRRALAAGRRVEAHLHASGVDRAGNRSGRRSLRSRVTS